jgi:ABC-type glycerol-3-phosphate transport system substrate-binding protein
MKPKNLFNVIAATLLAGLLATTSTEAQTQKKITLLTWNLPVYGEKIAAWTKEFNQKYPDIQVEWIDKKGTEWATFYQAQVAAGTPPDVVNIQGTLWAEYAAEDRLLDLTPYLAKDPAFKARFSPGALDLWSTGGKTWLAPWYFSKTLLFANKALMKASGIDAMPRSFDELMADAAKVKGPGKSGLLTTNFDWLYWPLFRMNGVEILDPGMHKAAFNTPAGLSTLTKLSEATKSGVVNNISWTGRWVEPNSAFAAGNVAFYMAPTSALFWAASKADWVDEKGVEVVELPGLYATPNNHGLGVSKTTKYPEAAVELLKIATSDKWQTVLCRHVEPERRCGGAGEDARRKPAQGQGPRADDTQSRQDDRLFENGQGRARQGHLLDRSAARAAGPGRSEGRARQGAGPHRPRAGAPLSKPSRPGAR